MPSVNMAVSFAETLKDKMAKIERLQDTIRINDQKMRSILSWFSGIWNFGSLFLVSSEYI